MSIGVFYFKTADNKNANYRIGNLEKLTGKEANAIREEIKDLMDSGFEKIFVDAKNVSEADLSGINEIIHAHYLLQNTNKKIVLVYCSNSVVEKWVNTTGLDRFVETAIIPDILKKELSS